MITVDSLPPRLLSYEDDDDDGMDEIITREIVQELLLDDEDLYRRQRFNDILPRPIQLYNTYLTIQQYNLGFFNIIAVPMFARNKMAGKAFVLNHVHSLQRISC